MYVSSDSDVVLPLIECSSFGGDVDANGVDRSQIRRMLALSPLERLSWLEETMAELSELGRLNDRHALR